MASYAAVPQDQPPSYNSVVPGRAVTQPGTSATQPANNGQAAIVTQPGTSATQPQAAQPANNDDWMRIPSSIPNCPRGLEYLTAVDQLLIKQKVEKFEVWTDIETENKYVIKNTLGQKVYFAAEYSDSCERSCCGSDRSFDLKIFDNFKKEVIHMYRPYTCGHSYMEVSAPPGNRIGRIVQEPGLLSSSFTVKNHLDETVLRIEGPALGMSFSGDPKFKVVSLNNENIGKIQKQWSGFFREFFTDADYFGVTFPMNLDVVMKALLLSATFLIDFIHYESN